LAITPEGLSKMVKMIEDGTISSKIGKKVFTELLENGGDPEKIVKDKGLVQISDEGQLKEIIGKVRDNNEQSIEDYKKDKDKEIDHIVGRMVNEIKEQENVEKINKSVKEQIEKRRLLFELMDFTVYSQSYNFIITLFLINRY